MFCTWLEVDWTVIVERCIMSTTTRQAVDLLVRPPAILSPLTELARYTALQWRIFDTEKDTRPLQNVAMSQQTTSLNAKRPHSTCRLRDLHIMYTH